jgi:hypothetical protein
MIMLPAYDCGKKNLRGGFPMKSKEAKKKKCGKKD